MKPNHLQLIFLKMLTPKEKVQSSQNTHPYDKWRKESLIPLTKQNKWQWIFQVLQYFYD